ncbi:hypothetical protein M422DRAFT_31342 [Sphaerobolus stellatus SS14]|uniref:Aminoglycoside phosphotransferase domain-containing protein n=1 Tax=Sphaerobolus stellatus (strain SS14) TaxID=990650 RepID=A0A0C9V646_SPHS4|nr:hypothetical protein M422DRAFT_31342 [Sphaerobolus stellatus SS14]
MRSFPISHGTLSLSSRHATPTLSLATKDPPTTAPATPGASEEYDEQRDIQRELRADGENPFPISRKAVRDVVADKLGVRVDRVVFLSSGTFHKAFLLHLDTPSPGPRTVVFRIARRNMHMPKLKTESEVATLAYLRTKTSIPVPTVYWYDSNPQNILGGEWIVMSKAPGVPLSRFYHTLSPDSPQLKTLLHNLATLLLPLFTHRFPAIGSLYFSTDSPSPDPTPAVSPVKASTTPRPLGTEPLPKSNVTNITPTSTSQITPGPIISYPFFGSSRGLLSHLSNPPEIDRGPWKTFHAYIEACMQREIEGVRREGMGMAVGRRPRVAPRSEEGSGSDDPASDSDAEDSSSEEEEEDGDGWGVDWRYQAAGMGGGVGKAKGRASSFASTATTDSDDHDRDYRDYRATQRTTFLVAHTVRREKVVREEMGVVGEVMAALREEAEGGPGLGEEGVRKGWVIRQGQEQEDGEDKAGEGEFTLDCHDLSLENVFVDEEDPTKITCIIDWESTCTRPLFQAAHLPAFLQPHHGHHHRHGRHHYSQSQTHTHTHQANTHAQNPLHQALQHQNALHQNTVLSPLNPHQTPLPLFPHSAHPHSTHPQAHKHYHHSPHHTPLYIPSTSPAANLFRAAVLQAGVDLGLKDASEKWVALEKGGAKRRWAHRCVEWDGWEEGLVGGILGELEYGWGWERHRARCHSKEGIKGKKCEEGAECAEGGVEEDECKTCERDVWSVEGAGEEVGRRLEKWVLEGGRGFQHGHGEGEEFDEDGKFVDDIPMEMPLSPLSDICEEGEGA